MDGLGEQELASLVAELDRYWSDQLRRATEIYDLLERRLAAVPRPELRLVSSVTHSGTNRTDHPPR